MNNSIKLLELVYDKPNCESLCMFLYNIKSGVSYSNDGTISESDITPLLNASAGMDGGYALCSEFYNFADSSMHILKDIELPDFGITIIMFLFARYYSRNQYAIMINTLHGIKEIEHMELYLKHYSATTNKRSVTVQSTAINAYIRFRLNADDRPNSSILTSNLATDDRFGIAANIKHFNNSAAITLEEFVFISGLMRSKTLMADNFINMIAPFHIKIIESFYIMTSITKDSKVIVECRELSIPQMKYTFIRPIRSAVYSGDYWFIVPDKAVWFAYHQTRRTYQTYISRDIDKIVDSALQETKSGVLVGFIHENAIYPVILDTPECNGDWNKTIAEFQKYNLPLIFNNSKTKRPPLEDKKLAKRLFFVKDHIYILYKYVIS